MTITRWNIAYVVSIVRHLRLYTRFWSIPRIHQNKGFGDIKSGHLIVEANTDVDRARSKMDRKSTRGYCTMVVGNLMSWKSKKQPVVSKSSSEAKYQAMELGTWELLWLWILLYLWGFTYNSPMVLHSESTLAWLIVTNPKSSTYGQKLLKLFPFCKRRLKTKISKWSIGFLD